MSLDERYEIRSKIGQGGVGAVYRAYDQHLKREVAIKRVLAEGGYENQEEATEAMLKEATALCSVQHPHIVTVFDAGVDKDGPYVVMELLSGRTVDEMVARGILTKEDFREVAVQSQEALIAAQDLDLVHRDIKPTNLMITWLASGRFQVKLVDFGLAKFSPKPSLQTIDHGDAVFGSIHFMAPEQFERTPLDKRTDMYSLGCVYYYCLTGRYPFDGENAAQVMSSHLQHSVTHISELRPDLPKWMSDWIMWHISRPMDKRPGDARESLKSFLMSENTPKEGTPRDPSPPIQAPPTARNPQTQKGTLTTPTAPEPIKAPEGQAPSIHTMAQNVKSVSPEAPAPRPRLLTPTQSNPAEIATSEPTTPTTPPPPPPPAMPASPEPTPQIASIPVALPSKKSSVSNAVKGMIAAALIAGIIIAAVIFVGKKKQTDRVNALNEITQNLSGEVKLDRGQVQLLLDSIATPGKKKKGERAAYVEALRIGQSSDGSDISEMVANFANSAPMNSGNRIKLFQLLGFRGDESALPHLINFASETSDMKAGQAALSATQKMANVENFDDLLAIIKESPNGSIKNSARDALSKAIRRSNKPHEYAPSIIKSYERSVDEEARIALLRLMGTSGGDDAAAIITTTLSGDDTKMKASAIYALRDWPDRSQFPSLLNYTTKEQNSLLRKEAFKASVDFLRNTQDIDESAFSRHWQDLADIATTPAEQSQIIGTMASQKSDWARTILTKFIENGANDDVEFRAERALDHLNERSGKDSENE